MAADTPAAAGSIGARVLRAPALHSVVAAVLVGALFLVGTGADPIGAYGSVVSGASAPTASGPRSPPGPA